MKASCPNRVASCYGISVVDTPLRVFQTLECFLSACWPAAWQLILHLIHLIMLCIMKTVEGAIITFGIHAIAT